MPRVPISGRVAVSGRVVPRAMPFSVLVQGNSNGKIDFGNNATYLLNTGAISFFIRKYPNTGIEGGLEISSSGNDRMTIYHVNGNIAFSLVKGGAVLLNNIVTIPNYANQWHHVVFTWDATSGVVYVDGNLTPLLNVAGNMTMAFPSNPLLVLGFLATGAGAVMAGYTHLSLFNAKLTAAEAQAIYVKNIYPASRTAFWDFSAGSGNVLLTSGSGNSGVLGSAAAWSGPGPFGLRVPVSGRVPIT